MNQQMTLLPEYEAPESWENNDDYETPETEARMVASLYLKSDRVVVDAGAGCGNITRFLPAGTIAVEPNLIRLEVGKVMAPEARWVPQDFLKLDQSLHGRVNLVIGNPPFSRLMEFINHSFDALLATGGRIVFLLPGDTFHKPSVVNAITTPFALGERKIMGRIAYLKDGKPQRGRQIYDSIFILRRAGLREPRIYSRQDFRGILSGQ